MLEKIGVFTAKYRRTEPEDLSFSIDIYPELKLYQNIDQDKELNKMSNKISKERKTIYYVGLGLTVLGVALFISSFFIVDMEPDFFGGMPPFFSRALVGMICAIIGGALTNIGAKGAAGSGLLLDPEKAREDLKPYSAAKGKMINDTIENIDIVKNIGNKEGKGTKEIIKIKCRECGALNDEDAKYCKSCGGNI